MIGGLAVEQARHYELSGDIQCGVYAVRAYRAAQNALPIPHSSEAAETWLRLQNKIVATEVQMKINRRNYAGQKEILVELACGCSIMWADGDGLYEVPLNMRGQDTVCPKHGSTHVECIYADTSPQNWS